jgi:ATP-dependent 26S proteasome regulatory subunit
MYVIRSALRASAVRPPARFIHGRRYPSAPRPRHFHTARALAQAAKPPPGPSDNTPVGDNDASKTDPEKAATGEHTDAVGPTDDPETIAHKLQRSRDTSRRYSGASRRQQRWSKLQELPPVHIPNWFLERRVIRREDRQGAARPRPMPAYLSVSIADAESGERATCSIPASEDMDAALVLSRLVRALWEHPLDDAETRSVEKYLSDRMAPAEKTASAEDTAAIQDLVDAKVTPISTSDNAASSADSLSDLSGLERKWRLRLGAEHVRADVGSAPTESHEVVFGQDAEPEDLLVRDLQELKKLIERPERTTVDANWDPQERDDALYKKKEARIMKWFKRTRGPRALRRAGTTSRIPPLVLAEIRATIAGSLSVVAPRVNDSYPATRTNLILHAPAATHEKAVNACIHDIADDMQADLITLTAQDLAQMAGDYLGEGSEPSPHSIRSLGYETYRMSAELRSDFEDGAEGKDELSRDSVMGMIEQMGMFPLGSSGVSAYSIRDSKLSQLEARLNEEANVLNDSAGRAPSHNDVQLEDLKLASLLEALLDASQTKQARNLINVDDTNLSRRSSTESRTKMFDLSGSSLESGNSQLELNSALPAVSIGAGISLDVGIESSPQTSVSERPKIIHIKDFKELHATQYGGRIIQKLEDLVRKRRATGESVMIIGTTCSRELTPELSATYVPSSYLQIQLTHRSAVRSLQGEGEPGVFRTIVVEGESAANEATTDDIVITLQPRAAPKELSVTERTKIRSINFSHIREMLKAIDPAAAANIADMEKDLQLFRAWAPMFPKMYSTSVLTYDEVHRLALTALGLRITNSRNPEEGQEHSANQISWAHVALAMGLLKASDSIKYASFARAAELAKKPRGAFANLEGETGGKLRVDKQRTARTIQRQHELRIIAAKATKHEQWLMPGIADPDQIKTTFDQVHVPPETIDAIRTITSLSLLRPDAFSYGILATEKITGALLYGPPGTGKTLLAKAVAKESGSTVLEVSSAQIMGKYVGESEKNVAAIFSLAQKLSPCIVFLDEADAILASRASSRERTAHRETMNQFLKEWDGLNDSSVFVMVATNRPFDLDDAVIRRLPRRLLVDLPTQTDRKAILRIHLAGEQLDESVDLDDLAKRTPFYSGSDLKNIVVSAALACVKEENEQAAAAVAKATFETKAPAQAEADDTTKSPESATTSTQSTESSATPSTPPKILHLVRGQSYNFPEKRVLHVRHFDTALQEISASISEDMSSLSAIKKFDEQYGDRKGKKRRKDFGFGALAERSESAARVRA